MKRWITLILALLLAFSIAACGRGSPSGNSGGGSNSGSTSGSANSAATNQPAATSSSGSGNGGDSGGGSKSNGKFESATEMLAEQNRLEKIHEKALNDMDNPSMQLAAMILGAPMSFNAASIIGIIGGDGDGKFGDLNSIQGYYEKHGDKLTIGTDYTVENSFGMDRSGDRKREEGEADLAAGWAWNEASTERDGEIISRDRNDHQFGSGSMTALSQFAKEFDLKNEPNKSNNALFAIIDEKKYEFVYGQMNETSVGTAKELMPFDAGMSVEVAKSMMEKAGYTIKYYGKTEDGKFTDLLK